LPIHLERKDGYGVQIEWISRLCIAHDDYMIQLDDTVYCCGGAVWTAAGREYTSQGLAKDFWDPKETKDTAQEAGNSHAMAAIADASAVKGITPCGGRNASSTFARAPLSMSRPAEESSTRSKVRVRLYFREDLMER
jgi:hypothetical protein